MFCDFSSIISPIYLKIGMKGVFSSQEGRNRNRCGGNVLYRSSTAHLRAIYVTTPNLAPFISLPSPLQRLRSAYATPTLRYSLDIATLSEHYPHDSPIEAYRNSKAPPKER